MAVMTPTVGVMRGASVSVCKALLVIRNFVGQGLGSDRI
jgi:hypothetical protein